MDNNLEKLMQKKIISENLILSNMIKDIVPKIKEKYTSLELETNKQEAFSLVVYKNQNIFMRFFKSISIYVEKLKIMRYLKDFKLEKKEE